MKRNFVKTGVISAVLAASALFASMGAQAAESREEIDQVADFHALKESGYTFPAIEQAMTERKLAKARSDAIRAAKADSKRSAIEN